MPFPSLPEPLAAALAQKGYAEPTAVQAAVLAEESTRDLLVSAKTGSGKTVAFGLAAAPNLFDAEGNLPRPGAPLALVVAPTRELALQVQRELGWLYARARVVACVGGMDPRREARLLHDGAHIVVGTPGRLCDHLDRDNLDLQAVRVLVLDEADEMLDMGFREELEHILVATPAERRTLMFSATVPAAIEQIAGRYQKDSKRIAVAAGEAHADIEYRAVMTAPRELEHAVVNILRFIDAPGALVFCHTRDAVNHLHHNLAERGFQAVCLSGELGQAERNRALQALRDGRARVCVATDVAARGIDLPDLGLVIHAEMPRDGATLLHRSGRTGRAGKKGIAAVIVPYTRRRYAERLFYEAKVQPRWMSPPPAEQIEQRDQTRLVEGVKAAVAEVSDEDRALARQVMEGSDVEALVAVLVRERREALPSPEEVTPWRPPPVPPPREPRSRLPRSDGPEFERPARQARWNTPAPEAPRAESPRFEAHRQEPPRAEAPRTEAPRAEPPRAEPPRAEPPVPEKPRAKVKPGWAPDVGGGEAPVTRRPPPPPRRDGPTEGGVWFRINVGQRQRADPKWLVPMLCRRGGIDKADIGRFNILANETRVLIRGSVAEAFIDAASRPDRQDPRVKIVPA